MTPLIKDFKLIGGKHGVSCVFPTLKDIINYESGKIKVNRGYPRFVIHPIVREIIAKHNTEETSFSVPVINVQLAEFLIKEYLICPQNEVVIENYDHYSVIRSSNYELFKSIFEAVRNAGIILNSRLAEEILTEKKTEKFQDNSLNEILKIKLSAYETGSNTKTTFLFPTGMSAIFSVILSNFDVDRPHIIMVGSPYVDTRDILEKLPQKKGTPDTTFIEKNEDIASAITDKTGLVLIEVPSNPLVRVPNVEQIINTAHQHGIPVAIDSTIASPYNMSPFKYNADIIIHSTTKFLNGMNDHIGGVVFVNPDQKKITEKIEHFQNEMNFYMSSAEAKVLLANMDGFPDRMRTINKNALKVAKYLERHPKIEKVYYCGLKSHPDYDLSSKYLPRGASGLISFVLKNSCYETAETFYDNCTLHGKGPSLGAELTLLCPITLFTFFDADEKKLKKIGQDKYTMRLSIGTEKPSDICRNIENGLSRL